MARNISRLIQKMKDREPSVRRRAAEDLAEGDERAIYPLIKALSDENAGVQDAAMRSLISIGGEVVAYMVLPLLRENSYLRNTALIILKSIGKAAVPLLYPLLKDKDGDVRKFAVDLLGDIREGVVPSLMIPNLKDEDPNVRAAVAKAFGALGYREAVPELIEALDDDEWVAFYAIEALGELGAVEAAAKIAGLLSSQSDIVRFAAIETLGKLRAEKAVDLLMAYLPKASGDEKNAVIKSLIQIGITPAMSASSNDLAGHLIQMLKEGDWEEKEITLRGIAAFDCKEAVPTIVDIAGSLDPSMPESEERIKMLKNAIISIDSEDSLLRLLESSDIKYRGKKFAIEMLGEMRSKKAADLLVHYLYDMRRDLRMASAGALGAIGEESALPSLVEASQMDPDAHVRRSAVEAVGNIGTKEAFLPLMELLEVERYYDITEKIVEALIKIDAPLFLSDISKYNDNIREIIAKTVLDVKLLLRLADDKSKKVELAAIYSLGNVGTKEAMLKLTSKLMDNDPDIRKACVIALGEARFCPPELFDAIHDDDQWVRFYTIKAVAFSCDREKAVEMISAMLKDEFIPVVMSAIDALKEIGGREAYEALTANAEHPNPDVRDKIQEAINSL